MAARQVSKIAEPPSPRPPERLGTSRPVGEESQGTITDGSDMVNEGLQRRTILTRGGLA